MQTLNETVDDKTLMILSTDSELLRFLKSSGSQ
jgi:hypothetical protein